MAMDTNFRFGAENLEANEVVSERLAEGKESVSEYLELYAGSFFEQYSGERIIG